MDIIETLRGHRPELARPGVKTIALFGSSAKDEWCERALTAALLVCTEEMGRRGRG